jgi:hypothetical protein
MPIIVAAELQPMGAEEQLAHCLYEMTWAGYKRISLNRSRKSLIALQRWRN